MIEELNEMFFDGFSVLTPHNINIKMQLAISCVMCDIPATRKLCGFSAITPILAVTNVTRTLVLMIVILVYWIEARTVLEHREQCRKINLEITKKKMSDAECKFGVRFSALLKLSYFDPIRYIVINFMHNLLLGTGKHMFCVWVELSLLSNSTLYILDMLIGIFSVPSNIGRLPIHICIKYNYFKFKAPQWYV